MGFASASRAALEATELPVMRRIDGIGKRVDVRGRSCGASSSRVPTGAEALARAGIVGDLVVLHAEVDVRGSGGVKIAEVVEATFGDAELPHRAVRDRARTRDGRGALRRTDGACAAPDAAVRRAHRRDGAGRCGFGVMRGRGCAPDGVSPGCPGVSADARSARQIR